MTGPERASVTRWAVGVPVVVASLVMLDIGPGVPLWLACVVLLAVTVGGAAAAAGLIGWRERAARLRAVPVEADRFRQCCHVRVCDPAWTDTDCDGAA